MTEVKTTWEYSLDTEARRVLHCAHQMVVGFYRVNNFYVLPLNSTNYSPNVVVFPDLPYNKIPRFWEKAKRIDIVELPIKADKRVVKEVKSFLEAQNINKPDFKNIQKVWDKASDEVIFEIEKIVPSVKGKIKEITVYPTILGAGTSFNLFKDGQIILYLREDQDIYPIVEAILTSITRKSVYDNLEGTWSESELLVDWLITSSPLSKILKKYKKITNFIPTLKGTRVKQKAKLLQESEKFYKKLGLPENQKVFGLNGLIPEMYQKPIENLNSTEKALLRCFIGKENQVVTFDEIGDILFKSDDDYSLYAITKKIERLRNKLEVNGLSGSYIQTLRGQGYILKN